MYSNTGNATQNLPDLNTALNDFEIAERLRRDSISRLQKISNVVHEFETKKKILQGDITASKNRASYYENLLLDLKNNTAIARLNKNKTELEACSNKKYIQQMKEQLHHNFQSNIPADMETCSISQLQARHDNLMQQKVALEENNIKNNSKMKEIQEILNNLKVNIPSMT